MRVIIEKGFHRSKPGDVLELKDRQATALVLLGKARYAADPEAGPTANEMRSALRRQGIKPDGRWGMNRLRREYERRDLVAEGT